MIILYVNMILYAFGIFILLISIYSFLIEPNFIHINNVPIANNKLFSVFQDKKVVQISDLHIKSIGYREKKLIKMLNRLNPDILFITGDFVTHKKYEDSCIKVLEQIRTPTYGIWTILGNADRNGFNERVKGFVKRLDNLGIKVLENSHERLVLSESDKHVFILGVEGPQLSRSKLNWLLRDIPDNSPLILLSHYPNVLEKNQLRKINLVLAGHTHGGQIRFPLIGTIDITPFHKISPYHKIVFDKGLFEIEGTKMYVNRGIGTAFLPMRFLCSPEIAVLKFTQEEKITKDDKKS